MARTIPVPLNSVPLALPAIKVVREPSNKTRLVKKNGATVESRILAELFSLAKYFHGGTSPDQNKRI